MRVVRGPLTGGAAGALWGVAVRAWMRVVTEHPEFSWEGTLYIVGASALVGLMAGLSIMATTRGWRLGPVVRVLAVASCILLGVGAGIMMVPTIVLGGVALGSPRLDDLTLRWRVVVALGIVGLVALGGVGPGSPLLVAGVLAVGVVVVVVVLVGWHLRAVVATLAMLPIVAVALTVLGSDIPLWRGVVGVALYLPVVAGPVLLVAAVLTARPRRGGDVTGTESPAVARSTPHVAPSSPVSSGVAASGTSPSGEMPSGSV